MHYFVPLIQKTLTRLFFIPALTVSSWFPSALAGIKVLDVELGVSTIEQVRQQATENGSFRNVGTNSWSQGPSIEVPASNYQIQGLQSVLYIFNPDQKLVGLQMKMDKARFDAIFEVLAGKYKLVRKVRPFVGNNYAKFTVPNSTIEIDAPHMGVDMQVRYMTNGFAKAWQDGVRAQDQQKMNTDKSSF